MSEQNILNPTTTSALNPDYSVKITDAATIARYQARSGKPFFRTLAARGQVFDLTWGNRLFSDADALVQWFHQYEKDFFSFADYDTGRYYSGMFADQPQIERAGNNRVNITAQFIVVPGLPMFQYPSRWGVDSVLYNVQDGFHTDLVKLLPAATWGTFASAFGKGPFEYTLGTANATGEWKYSGYGFRYWQLKSTDSGIIEISLDGTVVAASVDCYAAVNAASSPLFTMLNVPLGEHRVKIRITGTKNVASSSTNCYLDTLEVMR